MYLVFIMTLFGLQLASTSTSAQPADQGDITPVYLPLIFGGEATLITEEAVAENLEEAVALELAHIAPLEEQAIQAAATTTQKLAVPAYFYPEGANLSFWDRLATSDDKLGIVILNPDDGPGNAAEPNYVTQANRLRGRVTILGYVDTKSGQANKSVNQIQQEINNYYSWYPVNGIYLDNVAATNCANTATYRALYDYIQAKGGAAQVALGFGTDFSQCMFDQVGPKVIGVNFNDTYAAYQNWQPEAWTATYPANRFWHFVNGVSQANLAGVVNRSKQRNVNWIYITDDKGKNPWDTLPNPTYWQEAIRLISNEGNGNPVRVYPIPGNIIRTTDDLSRFQIGGYVYLDGVPVAGARVTIAAKGTETISYVTAGGDQATHPYYLTPTSPAGLKPGSTIRITVSYGQKTLPTQSYKILPGMQQLDFVIPGTGNYSAPIATISYRSHLDSFAATETLVLSGSGQGSIQSSKVKKYKWWVNDEPISSSRTIRLVGKSMRPGTYKISLQVEDQHGMPSAPVEIIYIRR